MDGNAELYEQKEFHRAVAHNATLWLTRCRTPLEAIAALYEWSEREECYHPETYRAAADLIDTGREHIEGATVVETARRQIEAIEAAHERLTVTEPEPANTRAVA